MRQHYEACVTSVVDYASTVGHDPLRDKIHIRHLRMYRATSGSHPRPICLSNRATTTLDVEAHVLPTHLHLRYRAQDTITRLHTLPQKTSHMERTTSGPEKTQQSWIVRLVPAIRTLENHGPGETTGNRND